MEALADSKTDEAVGTDLAHALTEHSFMGIFYLYAFDGFLEVVHLIVLASISASIRFSTDPVNWSQIVFAFIFASKSIATESAELLAQGIYQYGANLWNIFDIANRARFMTGGGYRLLASATFGELGLGCIEANICK